MPMVAGTTKGQCAVVEAGAVTHTCTPAIEPHPGAENGVEESSAEPGITLGFVHAEGVLAGFRAHRYEAHGARPEVGDTRQVHAASALPRELDEWPGAELLRHRGIEADAFTGREPMGGSDVSRDGGRRVAALRGVDRAALRHELLAKGLLRVHDAEERKALPAMPVRAVALDQSN